MEKQAAQATQPAYREKGLRTFSLAERYFSLAPPMASNNKVDFIYSPQINCKGLSTV